MSIKSKIQALITAANAKTGETDATLTDAVQTLVNGYGQGADPVINPLSVTENGTYTAPAGVDGYSPVSVNVSGGGASYVDVTLTQDYTSGNAIVSAIQTATGFDNFYAELKSTVPESGPCVFAVIKITTPNGSTSYLYRRNTSGTWGWASAGAQTTYANDVFRVWEVG